MTFPFRGFWRVLAFSLPVLVATGIFLLLSGILSLFFFQDMRTERNAGQESRRLSSVTFDLTSLDRTVQASFMRTITGENRSEKGFLRSPRTDPFLRGLSIQAESVLADLAHRQSVLPSPEQAALGRIRQKTKRYFSLLHERVSPPQETVSPEFSQTYRDLTFGLFSLSYRVQSLLHRSARTLRASDKKQTRLLLLEGSLVLLYVAIVLLLNISRRHTRQALLDFAAGESGDTIAITDREGRILFCNRSFNELLNEAPSDCEDRPLLSLLSRSPFLGKGGMEWENFLRDPTVPRRIVLPFGDPSRPHLSWLMVQMTPARLGGRPLYLEWKATDITRIKNAELALEAQGEWLRTTLSSIGDGVIATDTQGLVNFMNHVAERLTGYSSTEAMGKPVGEIFRIVNEKTGEPVEVPIRKVLRDDIVVGLANHTALVSRDGTRISISDSAAPIHDRTGLINGVVLVFQENTERRRAQELIWNLTYHDTLTRLPNRILFQDRLSTLLPWARDNGRILGVLALNIDHFKRINDSLGHGAGNDLLKLFSDRLHDLLPQNDTLARIGGDEFLILLTGCTDEREIARTCEKILSGIGDPHQISGQEVSLSASIGAAFFPKDGKTPDELVKNATIALHGAKEEGRNRYSFFEERMSAGSLQDLQMEQAIKQGLLRGEFYLEYQPQIETDSGKIAGVEALARWNHPDLGRVLPDDFIPLAEKTGLIVPLGQTVLRLALDQIRKWWEEGFRITVSVNLSYQHFLRPGFVKEMKDLLAESGTSPEALILEITESKVIKDSESFFAIVDQLAKEKIRISIDDFGTGATALSYLTTYPVAEVKIDRSLVRGCFSDIKRSELVRTIIGLGHKLNFLTVGEGVETKEEWTYLERQKCDRIQGFFASPSLSASALTPFLARRFTRLPGGKFEWRER